MAILSLHHYEQSLDYTCGPACLMMAMKHFDHEVQLDQATELDLWREATWVEPRGCSVYGLALAAHRRGFQVRLMTNLEDEDLFSIVRERRPDLDVATMRFMQEDLRRKCHREGLVEVMTSITMDHVREALAAREVPLVLTSTAITARDDIPHWIIVRGLEGGLAHISNPYVEDGVNVEVVKASRLEEFLGFRGWQCLLALSRPPKNRTANLRRRRSA